MHHNHHDDHHHDFNHHAWDHHDYHSYHNWHSFHNWYGWHGGWHYGGWGGWGGWNRGGWNWGGGTNWYGVGEPTFNYSYNYTPPATVYYSNPTYQWPPSYTINQQPSILLNEIDPNSPQSLDPTASSSKANAGGNPGQIGTR